MQLPQNLSSVSVSTHSPLHSVLGGWHDPWQEPLTQPLPPHGRLHPPQCDGFVFVLTHALPHRVVPFLHFFFFFFASVLGSAPKRPPAPIVASTRPKRRRLSSEVRCWVRSSKR